mmetsp:Transcript_97919/g.227054  ORF Transcript_97919/g.227054 Transcript_97919/m.227054 type:complete len:378 (-) Transcript_97919:83-1216(-)
MAHCCLWLLGIILSTWAAVCGCVHPESCASKEDCEGLSSVTHLLQRGTLLKSESGLARSSSHSHLRLPFCVWRDLTPENRASLAALPGAAAHSCHEFSGKLRSRSASEALGALHSINEVAAQVLAAKLPDKATVTRCLELIFQVIENFKDKPEVMATAWRGLAHHANSRVGANLVANMGGPMRGVDFIVEQMRAHPEPHLGESPEHLTLTHEILQTVSSMLEHDDPDYTFQYVYGSAFLRAGLPEQLLHAMRSESGLRGTQEVACNCMEWLFENSPEAMLKFLEGGVVAQLVSTMGAFRHKTDPAPAPMCSGWTMSDVFTVAPSCSRVLEAITVAFPEVADEMIQGGLLASLDDTRDDLRTGVFELRNVLQKRAQAM